MDPIWVAAEASQLVIEENQVMCHMKFFWKKKY